MIKWEINLENIHLLRSLAGRGLMNCKNALKEADGDPVKAIEILLKGGIPAVQVVDPSWLDNNFPNLEEIIRRAEEYDEELAKELRTKITW